MQRSRVFLLSCILAATGVLLALGFWQVARLHWKEALIAEIATRRAAPPATLGEIEERWRQTGDVDYWPVKLTGAFGHAEELYFYATDNGNVGWQVLTPFILKDGRVAIVNRGFVPDKLRDPGSREAGRVEGIQTVTGLARNPARTKPNRFVPDNRPETRTYFWKSLAEIAKADQYAPDDLVPFFIDAGPEEVPGGWPKGGATIVDLPNNHRQYAITWFGLSAACLGVGLAFLHASRKRTGAG